MSTLAVMLDTLAGVSRSRLNDLVALTKPRLNALVLWAAAAGFMLGAQGPFEPLLLVHALLGILLVASGASALNQVREREADGRMKRTGMRPLPTGRVPVAVAVALGVALSLGGTVYLWLATTRMAAALALLSLVLYVFLYTPLKRHTPLNTLVGAFPGALPPLIGWAASGKLNGAAGTLFAIVFLWQMPHFFAIAWLYRHDYARGGFKMLPVIEPGGRSTGARAVLYAAGLAGVSWMPTLWGLTGWYFAVGALVLSLVYLGFAIHFALKRTDAAARKLFLCSVIYLPLVLAGMIWDRV